MIITTKRGETGVGIVEDVNKDGKISDSDDMQVIGNRDPHFYGGLTNTLHYKNWSLDLTFYFRSKPHDYGYLWTNYYPVGYQTNVTHKMVKDSWTTPGQHAKYPGITTIDTGEIGSSFIQYLGNSDFAYSDASFLRLQYFELSYQIPAELVSRLHLGQARAYLQGRNLFTLTKYDSYDPESGAWELPCTSSIMLGFDLSF